MRVNYYSSSEIYGSRNVISDANIVRPINATTERISTLIYKMFANTNNIRKKEETEAKIILNRTIEPVSPRMKNMLALTLDYVINNKLIKSKKINSLKLYNLNDDSIDPDLRIQYIIRDIEGLLGEDDKASLHEYIGMNVLNASQGIETHNELSNEVKQLTSENQSLKKRFDAVYKMAYLDNSQASRWSFCLNNRRLASLKRISNDRTIPSDLKSRMTIMQLNDKALWGIDKNLNKYINAASNLDVRKAYTDAARRISKDIKNTEDSTEKRSLFFQMEHLRGAYEQYANDVANDKQMIDRYTNVVSNTMR